MLVGKFLKTWGPVAAVVLALAAPVHAAEVSGVKLEDSVTVGDQKLVLNGAGMRKKFVIKVYVAALYLQSKKTTTADVLALTSPKRVALVLQREVSSVELGQLFISSMNKNVSNEEKAKLAGQTGKFGEMFSSLDKVKKGDVIHLDWVPGQGTVSTLNGKVIGETLPDLAFYNAVLRIWLGDNPAQDDLKDDLLGKK